MRARFGERVRLKLVGPRRPFSLLRAFGGAPGAAKLPSLADPDQWLPALSERALWSRYGL